MGASVPKGRPNGTGRSNPRVIERHFFSVAGYSVERYRLRAISACRDHHSEDTVLNQLRARSAEPRGEQAISGRWRAAPLHVAENTDARLQPSPFLQLAREAQRVPGVMLIQIS